MREAPERPRRAARTAFAGRRRARSTSVTFNDRVNPASTGGAAAFQFAPDLAESLRKRDASVPPNSAPFTQKPGEEDKDIASFVNEVKK